MGKIKDNKLVYNDITEPWIIQANYLASMKDDSKVDDAISIATGILPCNWGTPPCSHTEIGFIVDGILWFASSTSRDGNTGTRWVKGSKLLRHPERWLLQKKIPPYTSTYLINECISRANNLMGLKYDFTGIFTDFTIPWAILRPKEFTPEILEKITKIYCSKFVHVVDTRVLAVYSPRRQFKWASKNEFKLIENNIEFLKGLRR